MLCNKKPPSTIDCTELTPLALQSARFPSPLSIAMINWLFRYFDDPVPEHW